MYLWRTFFTDVALKAFAAPPQGQVDYFDDALAGFGLRVSQKGTKAFFLLAGKKNNRRRQGLDRFGSITLAQARTKAKELLAEKKLGIGKDKTVLFKEAWKTYRRFCCLRCRGRMLTGDWQRAGYQPFNIYTALTTEIERAA